MEKKKSDHFRSILQQQREEALDEVSIHQVSTERIIDKEEKADRAASNFVETRITEDNGNLLKKIDFALQRLDAGTYQQCEHCGGVIPLARLEAKPSVSLCLACQELKDSGKIKT
jgi:DnaK suppressor protein